MARGGGEYDDDDDDEEGERRRPRRPNPDTLSYLRSLPLDVPSATEEIERYLARRRRRRGSPPSEEDDNDENNAEEEEPEYPPSLAASLSALNEIKHEIASLAGDEIGSQVLETLACIACPYSSNASRTLLEGLRGYHLHLATHRYGSHVVQSILTLSVGGKRRSDGDNGEVAALLDLDEDDEAEAGEGGEGRRPTIPDLILSAVAELRPVASDLAVHVCGSHVLRTLLCVLGGVELAPASPNGGTTTTMEGGAARRGKIKPKKKKKKKATEDDEAASGGGGAATTIMRVASPNPSRVDDRSTTEFRSALRTLTEELCGVVGDEEDGGRDVGGRRPGPLQRLACHPSAGPLLAVLLRVLTHSDMTDEERKRREPPGALDGGNDDEEEEAKRNKDISDSRLGMQAPEPTFRPDSPGHAFAKRLLCWKDDDGDDPSASNGVGSVASDVIYGLSGEPRGSRVLETVLRTAFDDMHDAIATTGGFDDPTTFAEYVEHDVSNYVVQALLCTTRSKRQAETLAECLLPAVRSGHVLDKSKRRGGVLWRGAEMCATFGVRQQELLEALRVGYGTLAAAAGDDDDDDDRNSTAKDEKRKKKRHKKSVPTLPIADCVARLVDLKLPAVDGGGRAELDVAGARTVHHLLRFEPKVAEAVVDGVLERLTSEELECIARDGLGSRCILDAVLDGPNSSSPPFSAAARKLFDKLSGRWASLSADRVGHHAVIKLFKSLPTLEDKALLTSELARSGSDRLTGNAMGRKVASACAVREFLEGRDAWEKAVSRESQREEWLRDVVGGGDDDGPERAGEGKKKRKRKRKKGGKGAGGVAPMTGEDDDDDDGANERGRFEGEERASAVESIMNAISSASSPSSRREEEGRSDREEAPAAAAAEKEKKRKKKKKRKRKKSRAEEE